MKAVAKRAVLAATLAIALVPDWGKGAAITWTGAGANSNVSTVANWTNGTTNVVPGAADDAHFAGTVDLTPNVDASDSWLDIFFDAGAGAFTVGPLSLGSSTNLLTLGNTTPSGGNITNNSTNTETINVDVKPRTGTVSATAGNLVFNGVFWAGNTPNRAQSGRFNTFAGAFNIYLNGPTTYGGGLVINGPGTVFMTNNANENNGEITVNNGSLQINVPNALGLEPGVTTTTTYATAGGIGGGSVTGDATAFTLIAGGADTGVLKLSDTNPNTSVAAGSVTFAPEPLTFQGRTTAAAQLDNVSGNNTWQGAITLQTSGNEYAIQSDAGSLSVTAAITNSTASATERALFLQGAAGGTISGNITDASGTTGLVDIDKAGAGTWTVSGTNSSIGSTNVTGGTLVYSSAAAMGGSGSFSLANNATLDMSAVGSVTIAATGTLGGSGTVKGSISDSAGTQILPGGAGTTGTLNLANNLTLAGGDTLQFDLSNNTAGSNDAINVAGNLALNGTTTLNLNLINNVLGSGTYDLINYGTTSGAGSFTLAGGGASGSTRQTIALSTSTPGQIDLNVTGQSANLTWTGSTSATWDLKTTKNFFNNGSSIADFYFDLDSVTFDDSSNVQNVNLASVLTPAAVTVNSSKNYTFSGPGSLNGSMALTKSGTGTLTILTTNTYAGGTIINAGTVQVGNGTTSGSLGTGPITDNGSLIFNPVGTVAVPGNISGNGSVTKQGSGEIDLSGASTYSGGTTISAGTLGAGGTTPLGTNGGGTSIASGARLLTLSNISIPGTVNVGGNFDGGTDGAIQASGGTSAAAVIATLSGTVNLTSTTQLAANQFATLAITGPITGAAGSNLSLVGPGAFSFGGANTYAGATSVGTGTTLQIQNGAPLGSGVTVASGGELFANSGVTDTNAAPITISGVGVDTQHGALRSGGAVLHTFTGPVNLAGNAAFSVDGGAQLNLSGNVTGSNTNLILTGDAGTGRILGALSLGSGSLTTQEANTTAGLVWIIGGAATYTGGTTISTGTTLQIGNAGTTGNLGAGNVSLAGGLTFNLTSPSTTISNNISGNGLITQAGTGTIVLTGNNSSFTGGSLALNAGVLSVGSSSALGSPSTITVLGNAATSSLDLNASGITVSGAVNFDGRALSAANTVPVGFTSEGSNTISGAITLQTGGNAYGIQSNSGTLTISGLITNNTASATERFVYLTGAGNGVISGGFSAGNATGGPGISLIKDGAGTWTLSNLANPNGLTGNVIVKQGTLAINGYVPLGQGALNGLASGAAIATSITVDSGATYDLTNFSNPSGGSNPSLQLLQTLAGGGTVNINSSEQLQAFADNTIAPGIPGSPGTLNINGSLHLSTGGDANDPAGNFPQGTTLSFGLGATPGSASDALSVTGTIDADDICNVSIVPLGGTMNGTYTLVNAGNITGAVASDLQLNNATRYSMALSTTATQIKVTISGSTDSITWSGAQGTWDTKVTAAWTGPHDSLFWTADTVNFTDAGSAQPTVSISGNVAPAAVNVSSNTTAYTFSGTGAIIGGASLNKTGSSSLTISSLNTYSGGTNVSNGTIIINAAASGSASPLGAVNGTTTVSGTGTVDFNNISSGAQKFIISGNGFGGEGALVNNAPSTSTTDNAGGGAAWATQSITLAGDASIGGSGTGSQAGRWDLRDSAVGANDAFLVGNGHNLTKVGPNQIWLVGAQISNLNSLTINAGEIGIQDITITNTSGNTTITTNTGATLGFFSDIATGQSVTANWVFNGSTNLNNSSQSATLNGPMIVNGPSSWTTSVPLNINSSITGSGVITTAGAGTTTFSGANNFGGLTVSGGTTAVTGNTVVGQLLGSAASTLNVSGGTLAATAQNHATATFTAVNITGGGTLDIGNGALVIAYTTSSPLTTIVNNLKSSYDKGAWDLPGLTSSATHSAKGTTLGYLDTGTQVEVKYTWYGDLDFSGTVTSSDLTAMNAGNGSSWAQGDLNYDGIKNADDFALFMEGAAMQNGSIPAGVPEPGAAALLALALPAMGLRRRMRRS